MKKFLLVASLGFLSGCGSLGKLGDIIKSQAPPPLRVAMLPQGKCPPSGEGIKFSIHNWGILSMLWKDADHLVILESRYNRQNIVGANLNGNPADSSFWMVDFRASKAEELKGDKADEMREWFYHQRERLELDTRTVEEYKRLKAELGAANNWSIGYYSFRGQRLPAGYFSRAGDMQKDPGNFVIEFKVDDKTFGPFAETDGVLPDEVLDGIHISPDKHYVIYKNIIQNVNKDGGAFVPSEVPLYTSACSGLVRVIPKESWKEAALVFNEVNERSVHSLRVQLSSLDPSTGWKQPLPGAQP